MICTHRQSDEAAISLGGMAKFLNSLVKNNQSFTETKEGGDPQLEDVVFQFVPEIDAMSNIISNQAHKAAECRKTAKSLGINQRNLKALKT